MTTSSNPCIPAFHLLCMVETDIAAFEAAKSTYQLPESIHVTYHNNRLADLDSNVQFDAIVSPANSYGRMDGGFDDALSRAFSPSDDYLALTRVAQAAIYSQFRGLAFPGSCLIIGLEGEETLKKNPWGCKWLAFCPTMKVPQEVAWDKEVVYECVWSLLAAIDRHNREVRERKARGEGDGEGDEIQTVLMTPLATATGSWSAERWAAQTVLAMKHFVAAVDDETKWKSMGPFSIMQHSAEVEKTHSM